MTARSGLALPELSDVNTLHQTFDRLRGGRDQTYNVWRTGVWYW